MITGQMISFDILIKAHAALIHEGKIVQSPGHGCWLARSFLGALVVLAAAAIVVVIIAD
jgi:hypothetical protein